MRPKWLCWASSSAPLPGCPRWRRPPRGTPSPGPHARNQTQRTWAWSASWRPSCPEVKHESFSVKTRAVGRFTNKRRRGVSRYTPGLRLRLLILLLLVTQPNNILIITRRHRFSRTVFNSFLRASSHYSRKNYQSDEVIFFHPYPFCSTFSVIFRLPFLLLLFRWLRRRFVHLLLALGVRMKPDTLH